MIPSIQKHPYNYKDHILELLVYTVEELPLTLLRLREYFFPKLLTVKTINQNYPDASQAIISKVNAIKNAMGIGDNILIKTTEHIEGGSSAAMSRLALLIDKKNFLLESTNAQDFIIAHELSHHFYRHVKKLAYIKLLSLFLHIFPLIHAIKRKSPSYFIQASLIHELIRFHVIRFIQRCFEKQADLKAIKVLKTNQGAIESLTIELSNQGAFYYRLHTGQLIKKGEALKSHPLLRGTLQKVENQAGNLLKTIYEKGVTIERLKPKYAMTHPLLHERLDYCRSALN